MLQERENKRMTRMIYQMKMMKNVPHYQEMQQKLALKTRKGNLDISQMIPIVYLI